MRIAVLVSGTGTILRALLDESLPVAVVASDRPCDALSIAEEAGVEALLVDRAGFGGFGPGFDRDAYSAALADMLVARHIDLVVMAGFGTVLAEAAHRAFPGRILNTHPALLPAHPGWHAVADALEAGDAVTGCTVHVAGLAVDSGPVLAQQEVAVENGDTVESLHERIKTVERRLYPQTVRRVLDAMEDGQEPASVPPLVHHVAEAGR